MILTIENLRKTPRLVDRVNRYKCGAATVAATSGVSTFALTLFRHGALALYLTL